MAAPDQLSLIVGNRRIQGWQAVRVTRGIERLPSDFDLLMTERYPGELSSFVIQPGDACQVLLGDDLVITGYVERFMPSLSGTSHSIRVQGRGKCCDLVDCAAEWPNNQISNCSVLQMASKLAQPYGITVSTQSDVGGVVPQINFMYGERAFDLIERVCRWRALLAYDDVDGNLVLSRVGVNEMASGFTEGQNVQSASFLWGMDQRYSEVQAYRVALDVLHDTGDTGNLILTANDPNVPRHRRYVVVAESGDAYDEVITKRAHWEVARRLGRSYQLRVTVDSWRDSAGTLWTPNSLAPIYLPSLKLDKNMWVIGEVTWTLDERGTSANLLLMPPEAFAVEPLLYMPFPRDVAEAMGQVPR